MKSFKTYPTRQIKDLRELLEGSVNQNPDKAVYLYKPKKNMPYEAVSYKTYGNDVKALGTRICLGEKPLLKKSRAVAILSEARYEWYVTYLAVVNSGAVIVPIDKDLPAYEIANMLRRSHAEVLIYSGSQKEKIHSIADTLPELTTWVRLDEAKKVKDNEKDAQSEKAFSEKKEYLWRDLLEEGQSLRNQGNRDYENLVIDPDALHILLFTSGTTQQSKAVQLSHRNIATNLMDTASYVKVLSDDVFLSILPLHHTYECTCGFLCPVYAGATIAQCEGLRYIQKNMKEAKVTVVLLVSLIMEAFYKNIKKAIAKNEALTRKVNLAHNICRFSDLLGFDLKPRLFKQVHEPFGEHLRLLISGGAPIDPQVLQGMKDFGFLCLQGYGLTECSPILALNPDDAPKNEAAGIPLLSVDLKIDNPDEQGIGEIIAKGDNIMLGYYENDIANQEAFTEDGYYKTGDLGYIDSEGYLIITGRKKNVIITANGKNVFPEELEQLMSRTPEIEEVVIFEAEDFQGEKTIAAEIFPQQKVIEAKGLDFSVEALEPYFKDFIKSFNKDQASYKAIRSLRIRLEPFEKTTSKKICRNKINPKLEH